MHNTKQKEATYDMRQQIYGKMSWCWGDSEDNVKQQFCPELAKVFGSPYYSTFFFI